MAPSKEAVLKQFGEFVHGLKKTDHIALLFDSDPDGMCSAVIASKAIEQLTGKRPEMRIPGMYGMDFFGDRVRAEFRKLGINKLMVFDLSVDSDPIVSTTLPLLERQLDSIALFDHHPVGADLSSDKTLVVKSQFVSSIDPAKYCTSKLVFDSFSPYTDVSDSDWVAGAGILADVGYPQWTEFVDGVCKKYNLNNVRTDRSYGSDLGKVVSLIMDTFTVEPKNALKLFEQIYAAKKPQDLYNSEFMEYRALIEAETQYWLDQFDQKAERFPNKGLTFFEISPKFKIKSFIANRISFQLPQDQTVIIIQNTHSGIVSFSARRQDGKKNLNHIVQKAVEGIPTATAGGHVQASAGMVPEKDWPLVKQRLIALF